MTAPATTIQTTTETTTSAPADTGGEVVRLDELDDDALMARLGGVPGEEAAIEKEPEKTVRRVATAPDEGSETGEAEVEEEPATEKPKRPLAAQFTVRDPDGTEVDFDPDVVIEFEAGGKKRKMALDKVVRLAGTGIHNENLTREVQQHREYREKMDEQLPEVIQTIKDLAAENTRLLTDPDFLLERQREYEASNTPDEQLRRERKAREDAEAKLAAREREETVGSFLRSGAIEAVEPLKEAIEGEWISEEEVIGRMMRDIEPLKGRDGIIPHTKTKEVHRILTESTIPWALERAAARRKKFGTPATKPGAKPGEAAGERTTRALTRRTLTRPLATRASTASSTGPTKPGKEPPKPPIRNINDGVERLVDRLVETVPP